MKSAIRRYCNEEHDVLSAKDMRTALSERPVRGTTACVCSVNESQETLDVKKIENFSRYHNFKFESNGIRVWRAYGVGQGRLIPYQDIIVKPQGPTDLAVDFSQSRRLESILRVPQLIVKKPAVFSLAQSQGARWSLRNSVSLRITMMLASTDKCLEDKCPEAPKRCMTNSE